MLLLYVLLRVYLCMKNLNYKLHPNPLHLLVLHDSLNPRNIILKMRTGRGRGNSNKPVCPFGLYSRSSTRLLNKQEISQIRIPMSSKYYLNYRDIQRKFPMVPSPFQRCCVRCKRCSVFKRLTFVYVFSRATGMVLVASLTRDMFDVAFVTVQWDAKDWRQKC